jgi:isoquinoline 1-oxidoreductase beta subunit
MSEYFDLERRSFLKSAAVTGVVVLGTRFLPTAALAATADAESETPAELFVAMKADGSVEITCHRSEMGQHIRTAIAQIVADELEVDWTQVVVIQALGDKRYGDQDTDGSKSIRLNFDRLRVAGAMVRTMLEQAAAERWGIAGGQCRAQQHEVIADDGRRLSYAALVAQLEGRRPPPAEQVQLKTREQWRYIGKGTPIVDMQDIISGRAEYAADVRLPGTLVAVIARPPVVLATPVSWDTAAAKKVPGVIDVIRMPDLDKNPVSFAPLGGIAVLAKNTWAAEQARGKLNVKWSASPNDSYDSNNFRKELEARNRRQGDVRRDVGNIEQGLREATSTLSAEYYVPLLAHAPMEPPAATARTTETGVEIWACTQNPQQDMSVVARYLGLAEQQVVVHVTLLGGAFGRKSKPDFSAEAAWLARKTGQAVRVQWSREDDIHHGFYHTVSSQRLDGGLDANNKLLAFRHRSTFPTIGSTFEAGATKPGGEVSLGLVNTPLDIAHIRAETGRVEAHVRTGWMRSVANIYHCFGAQSFLAELAHSAGRDHRDFLLEAIGSDRKIDFAAEGTKYSNHGADPEIYPYDTARLKNVLRLATEKAGWGRKLAAGSGLGLAVHRSFLTYVATVVEVEVASDGALTIPAVWIAVDAGTVVNTDSVVNQMEGGTLFALSFALYSEITASEGRIEQSNFHDYPVARIADTPLAINVQVVESNEAPAGVGEPGTPPFAPALCNAIEDATGVRIRELPIADQLSTAMAAMASKGE